MVDEVLIQAHVLAVHVDREELGNLGLCVLDHVDSVVLCVLDRVDSVVLYVLDRVDSPGILDMLVDVDNLGIVDNPGILDNLDNSVLGMSDS
jgi:hypothetical protein